MKNLSLITSNKNKVKEIERYLGHKINWLNIDLDEVQSLNLMETATYKAKQAWKLVKKPILIWDQAVYISCLNGFPGPLIKWFWETVSLEKICSIVHLLQDIKISTETMLVAYDGKKMQIFQGKSAGTIPSEARGKNGFGWDSIFIPEGSILTNAEMDENHPHFHLFLKTAVEKLKIYLESS